MDISELIYEGVRNSKEAGALKIDVDIKIRAGYAYIAICDDGAGLAIDDAFRDGVSTKGKDRGFGLGFVKRADPYASIIRLENCTRLSFKVRDDGSIADLFKLFFPLADEERAISLKLEAEDKSPIFIKRDSCKIDLDFIKELKRECEEKGDGDV